MKNAIIVTFTTLLVTIAASPYYDAIVVEGRDDSEGLDDNETFESEDCLLPARAGPCRAGIPMYYYDVDTGKCYKFRWGGCGGNRNRFQSRSQCERKCSGVSGVDSSRPSNSGAGIGGISCERNPANLKCGKQQGCFSSRDQDGCYECRCPGDATTSRPRPEVCDLPPARGHCRALLPRWTYNVATGKCQEFRFGGCDGNGNNFITETDCQETCEGRKRGQRQPSASDRYDVEVQQPEASSQYGTTDYTSAAATFFKYMFQRFWQQQQ